MLSAEMNDRLTRLGPGTAMGSLLRRYWVPIAAVNQVGDTPLRRRILGEDLVLFRDGHGRYGLVQERCPHRNVSLAYGIVESSGLRCAYHGWLFDACGRCLEQPAEPATSTFKDKVEVTAYEVQALGGLLFAYMGPSPAPLLPRYDLYVDDNVWRDIGWAVLPCNWLQIMENTMDPHHVEWLHGRYMNSVRERTGGQKTEVWTKRHVKIGFDTFEHGLIKRRVLEGMTEDDDDWRVGHPLVMPWYTRVGSAGYAQFQIRVPMDDTHTMHIWYNTFRPHDGVVVPPQPEIPCYRVPYLDDEGEFITDFVDGQDIMAWCSPGPVTDRTKENICKSDRGVILLRRVLQQQLARIENGQDPIGIVRDPATNDVIVLPQEYDKAGSGANSRREFLMMGSTRYSPIIDDVVELYERAVTG
jgi:5,5'-dehydrodivanillate O-demethylase oxygenase subunit